MKLQLSKALVLFSVLAVVLTSVPTATAQAVSGTIQNLRFAIERDDRSISPIWVKNGGHFELADGHHRVIRAVADQPGKRDPVNPGVTYRVVSGGEWVNVIQTHENRGTAQITAEKRAGSGVATIEWQLLPAAQAADGVTRGTIEVSVNGGRSTNIGSVVTQPATAQRIVSDLYQAILLRPVDPGGQGFIDTVTREGTNGIARVARDIANSQESYTDVYRRGNNAQRLTAMYQYLQGRTQRNVPADEWQRYLNLLEQGKVETVVLDLLWSDSFFARNRLTRPSTRPADWGTASATALDTRFRGLDSNGDGRITRTEWRGNDVSFANHDWNDDGILSGLEIQAGGTLDAASARFSALDRNRNGLLSRTEWTGRADDFLRLDRNRDDMVSRAEFENPTLPVMSREDRFRALDTNGDGILQAAELRGATTLVEQLDGDHDGRVTRNEYLNPPSGQSRLQLFLTWDHDDNGYLTRTEWHADTASFNTLDGDLDGLVSLREYLGS